jgi:hypothetical protein
MSDSSPRWDFSKSWRAHGRVLRAYWSAYGGWWAVVSSPYLQIALVLSVIYALVQGVDGAASVGIDLFSSLLGFTIGAVAIVLAVSATDVFVFLAEDGEPHSFFIKMVANFVHYTIVQALGLVVSVLTEGVGCGVGFLATLLIFYAIVVSISIAFQLFDMARVYNTHAGLKKPSDDGDASAS